MKPKRKPKNKNLSVDEQIEAFLEDDEYIIWSAQTQRHYYGYARGTLRQLAVALSILFIVAMVVSLFLDPIVFGQVGSFLCSLLCIGVIFFVGLIIYSNNNLRKFAHYINVITNHQVMIYDSIAQDMVFAFEHDVIHKFSVREYGNDIGNIIVDRRSDQKAKYRVSPKYPLEFALRGIDDLSTVVNLLRSQLGIEPEYLHIYSKQKR